MAIVNYVREHVRFIEYAADEKISASERLLWYALMHIANQRAQGNVWPDEFIRVNNDRLLTLCPMKLDTLAKARNGLKQRGLIDFLPGEKNRKSPAYKVNYFYPQPMESASLRDGEQIKMDLDPPGYPKKSDYMGVYPGDYMGGNTGGYMGDNPGDYSINLNIKGIPKQESGVDDDDDAASRARERAVSAAILDGFGRKGTPEEIRQISAAAGRMGFDAEIAAETVRIAAGEGARSVCAYVLYLFNEWRYQDIRTAEELTEYRVMSDAARGKNTLFSASEEEIEEARERRIREHREQSVR